MPYIVTLLICIFLAIYINQYMKKRHKHKNSSPTHTHKQKRYQHKPIDSKKFINDKFEIKSKTPYDTVVLDTETVGSGANLRIIEIGAIFLKDGQKVKTYSQLINPEQPIPFANQELSGIHDDDVMHMPTAQEVIPSFINDIQNLTIMGHNVAYDIAALNREAARLGIPELIEADRLDTQVLAKEKFPNAPSYTLQEVLKLVGVSDTETHRALSDAQHTLECWNRMIDAPTQYNMDPDEFMVAKQRAEKTKQLQKNMFAKSHALSKYDTTPINEQPEGTVIKTIECGVDINGEDAHQPLLEKYGYDAWLWVYVTQAPIRKGKFKGYPTYWVYLDGEEIGHITKLQMERHYGQVPHEGAVMLAHIPNTKADRERGFYQLRVQMPEAHEPTDLSSFVVSEEE